LKIDVVEVNFGVRGVDATNIYQDGTVSYRARVNTLSQIQASTGEDFAEDARIQTANTEDCFFCAVRRLERGAQVRIHKMKIKEKQVDVELDKASGAKHEIHLKFSSADYTIDDVPTGDRTVTASASGYDNSSTIALIDDRAHR